MNQTGVGATVCESTVFNGLHWPSTPAGRLAVIPCPWTSTIPNSTDLDGSRLPNETTVSGNISRLCYLNGTWSPSIESRPLLCSPMNRLYEPKAYTAIYIYSGGYAISLTTLVIVLLILNSIKSLKCTRNTIHCNLIVSFITAIFGWIILYFSLKMHPFKEGRPLYSMKIHLCSLVSVIYNMTYSSTYFWMLAEGVFLYQLITRGFVHMVSPIKYFVLLGWGTPLAIVIALSALRFKEIGHLCILVQDGHDKSQYILGVLYIIIIFVNAVIFGIIVIIVWKKAKANPINNRSKSYKGLFFLAILLGVSHFLTTREDPIVKTIIAPTFISLQGFMVSLYFCFLNDEVQEAIVSQCKIWKNRRDSSSTNGSTTVSTMRHNVKVSEVKRQSKGLSYPALLIINTRSFWSKQAPMTNNVVLKDGEEKRNLKKNLLVRGDEKFDMSPHNNSCNKPLL